MKALLKELKTKQHSVSSIDHLFTSEKEKNDTLCRMVFKGSIFVDNNNLIHLHV